MKSTIIKVLSIIIGFMSFIVGGYISQFAFYEYSIDYVLFSISFILLAFGAFLILLNIFLIIFPKKKTPDNICSECGSEILDDDTLCMSCYRKKKILAIVLFALIWIITAVLTAILLKNSITFAFWIFWILIMKIKKSSFITERKLYQGIPVTLEELAMHEIYNEETVNKYKKTPNAQRNGKEINFEDFKQYIDIIKFRDIAKIPKSNLISDYPGYYEFVHGVPQPQTPAQTPVNPIPPDIQFPKYTEEQNEEDERDKLLKRISDLYRENEELKKRKPKKALVAVIVILSVLLTSVSGFAVYQQFQIQDLDNKYHDTHFELYEEKSAREKAEAELARIDFQKDAYNFYLKNAVCVYPDGPYYTYYHKATCKWFKSADKYWIYNIEAAKAKGYKPCPNCFTYN